MREIPMTINEREARHGRTFTDNSNASSSAVLHVQTADGFTFPNTHTHINLHLCCSGAMSLLLSPYVKGDFMKSHSHCFVHYVPPPTRKQHHHHHHLTLCDTRRCRRRTRNQKNIKTVENSIFSHWK
jgi:hypothetical protein